MFLKNELKQEGVYVEETIRKKTEFSNHLYLVWVKDS